MNEKISLLQQYCQKFLSANKESTKKEAFKDLLNRLYAKNKDIVHIIDKITLGAETSVINIPRKNKLHRDSADTLNNNIIIEFENNLKQSGKHAKEQLAGYLLGQFNSGEDYHFTLIASDFIEWRLYAPDISCLANLNWLKENDLIFNKIELSSFVLTENNAENFYYWIDCFLFKEEFKKTTLKRIEESFGYQIPVFIESFRELTVCFEDTKKFINIAYGSFDASESNFLIHTYLSVFSKLLAYAVMSNINSIDDEELRKTIDGSIFSNFNIANFVDNDFFQWVKSDRSFNCLKKVFRLIAREISVFNFDNVDEDILEGVYQELIDFDTRHALGKYCTPNWLCERIVDEFVFKPSDTIIGNLDGVAPLFRIPSYVLFVPKLGENGKRGLPASGLSGLSFSGNLPTHNCKYDIARHRITETDVTWFYAKQGNSTAFSTRKTQKQTAVNPYKDKFKQGATIVPRTLCFVELTQETLPDFEGRIINFKTCKSLISNAKAPCKNISLSGQIESRFIFRTALSKSILPFALYQPDWVVFPISVEKDSNADNNVLQMILAFKQICNHPTQFLKNGKFDASLSGKTELLLELLDSIVESGESPMFYHGGCSVKKREKMVRSFQHNRADKFFLFSLKAAGTGLNLTAASHVIHYDLWWNPVVKNQATCRVYRIGQTKNVMVHRMICKNTFEERIDEMIQKKNYAWKILKNLK